MNQIPFTRLSFLLSALISISACTSKEHQDATPKVEDFPASPSRDVVDTPIHTSVQPQLALKPGNAVPTIELEGKSEPDPVDEVQPESFLERMKRARLRFNSQAFTGARSDYEQAVQERPGRFGPRVQLARTLIELNEIEEARGHIEIALELDSDSSLAWNTMGRIELAEKDRDAAIVSFQRAVSANEDNSFAWNNLGFTLIEEEDFVEAVEALEKATSGSSPTSYMWNNLGMAYEHVNQIDLARASYRQAAETGSSKAKENLDRLVGVVSLLQEDDSAVVATDEVP